MALLTDKEIETYYLPEVMMTCPKLDSKWQGQDLKPAVCLPSLCSDSLLPL